MGKNDFTYRTDLVEAFGEEAVSKLEMSFTKYMCPKCTEINLDCCYSKHALKLAWVVTGPFRSFIHGFLLGKNHPDGE